MDDTPTGLSIWFLANGSVILSVAFGVRKGQNDEPLVRKTRLLANSL
jgi:hypothetical protein